jgi:uncharacterized protein YcfL
MQKYKLTLPVIAVALLLAACTEEKRNELSRDVVNVLGENLKVSYVDGGVVVKTWTVKDSKITTGKDEHGMQLGYYYFWSEETGYVQLPIERTIIEEIK